MDRNHKEKTKLYLCLNSHNRFKLKNSKAKEINHPQTHGKCRCIYRCKRYLEWKALYIIVSVNNVNTQRLHNHCNLTSWCYHNAKYNTLTDRFFCLYKNSDYCMYLLGTTHTLKLINIEESHRHTREETESGTHTYTPRSGESNHL